MNKYDLLLKNKDSVHLQPMVPSLCFIKNELKNPNIIVGDYTYYDADSGVYNLAICSSIEIE